MVFANGKKGMWNKTTPQRKTTHRCIQSACGIEDLLSLIHLILEWFRWNFDKRWRRMKEKNWLTANDQRKFAISTFRWNEVVRKSTLNTSHEWIVNKVRNVSCSQSWPYTLPQNRTITRATRVNDEWVGCWLPNAVDRAATLTKYLKAVSAIRRKNIYANTIFRRWRSLPVVFCIERWYFIQISKARKKNAHLNWKMVIKSRSKGTNRLSCDTSIYNCAGRWNKIACKYTDSSSRQHDSG